MSNYIPNLTKTMTLHSHQYLSLYKSDTSDFWVYKSSGNTQRLINFNLDRYTFAFDQQKLKGLTTFGKNQKSFVLSKDLNSLLRIYNWVKNMLDFTVFCCELNTAVFQ